MKRVALVFGVVALAGCGGSDSPDDKLREDVKQKTEQIRERVEESGGKPDVVDEALLEIERSDLPDDVKRELLEAKELLDKQLGK